MGAYEQAAEARMAAAKIAAAAKAAKDAEEASKKFAPTGNVFTDTLNKLRAERGITPGDVNASNQLDVYGVTENRIAAAQAVAAKPIMSEEQKAGGGVVKWVGGINGEYQIIMPTMSPLIGSKAAGWEPGRNNLAGKPPVNPTVIPSTTKTIKSSVKNPDGTTTITYTDGTETIVNPPDTTIVKKVDSPLGGNLENPAFSIVEGILKNYDMKGVADSIAKIRADYPEIASADILALLKFDTRYNAPYLERFAGNAALIKKGLPTLNDDLYLKAEKEYETIFKAYDVGSLANRKMYATLIGNSMDAVDVTGRLKIGYDRLKSDKNIEEAFRKFYPSLGTGDIVAAMLNPDEMLPMLERKAAAAEIGGSYLAQGLEASKISAESLAAYGVTKAGAQAGVRYIAQALPRGKFLSQISGETGINYTQETAEEITFKKNVKAQQQEDILKAKEIGRFSAESGTMGSKSFASQQRGAGLI